MRKASKNISLALAAAVLGTMALSSVASATDRGYNRKLWMT